MSRVEEAQDIVDSIEAYTEAVPIAYIDDRFFDRFGIVIMADIMKSLAVIADSVNKEEKNGR